MIYLSICVPTLQEQKSKEHLARLMTILKPQLTEEIELIIDDRGRNLPTGTKRNEMYTKAKGLYVCSVDCDDWIAPTYCDDLLIAIKNNMPDVVTFDGWYTENDRNRVDWSIKLGERYEARYDAASGGKYMFFRFPNHLVPMKKEIAIKARFTDVWQGEDFAWACKINDARNLNGVYVPGPNCLLKTEIHIYKQLYHYNYQTVK